MPYERILCIDFDGVLHSYTTKWMGADTIPDPPVEGAIDWLISLCESKDFKPMIYSSRSKQSGGIAAMRIWLRDHGFPQEYLGYIEFPTRKPPAFLTIDDRAICFDGTFPSHDDMRDFKPWNKRGV